MMSIIQEYSNHLEEIFENSFDFIYLHDKKGNILDVNNVVIKNLGYSKNEILQMKVTDFLIEEVILKVSYEIKKTIETGVVNKPKTYKVKKKDGHYVYVEAGAIPLKRDGKFYAILGIGHDVTKYVELEQKLKESEEEYRLITETANDLIRVLNDKFEIEFINESAHITALGYSKEDLLGKTDIILNHPNEYTAIRRFMRKVFKIGEGTHESRNRHKNGKWIWFEVKVKMFQNDRGNTKYLIISRDITDRKKSEQKLKEHARMQNSLNKIITFGNESTSLQEFLTKSYDEVLDIVSFDRGGVFLYDAKTQHNILVHHKNVHPDFIAAVEDIDISEGVPAEVFNKDKPIYIEDFSVFMEESNKLGIYSVAIIPLRSKDQYVGSLNISSSFHQTLTQNELKLLVAIGKQMGIIIQKFESEKMLKESEEKFRAITEQSFMSIMVIQDGILKYFNERLPKRIGYSAEEISNWKPYEFIDVIHPDYRDFILEQALKKEDGQEDVQNNYIYRSIRKDGTIGWVENFSKTIKYGGRTADLVMSIDITEKLEAERALKESEEKFRTLFEKANDGILLTDTETEQILTGNKKICEMLGYSIEELNSLSFKDLHPEESLHYVGSLFSKEHEGDSSIALDIPMKRKDGSIFYCNVNSSQIELSGKSYFMGIFRDITERKNAEQRLRESEEKFRNIAEQSFMGILIVQKGEIKYMNKAISKISGYSLEEIKNWTQKDILKRIYPKDIEYLTKRIQSNLNETMSSFSANYFRIINKNGEIKWLEDYTSRIIYEGKPANLISIIDITDKKEAEQLIIEENERLLELHELRKDIITRVSHELKTPMTSIYGANQILIKLYMDEIGEEAQKYVEIGHRGALRLKQLIDNLLDVSRLDAKKIDLKLQNENLIDLVIDSVKDMNYLAANRQLKLKLDLPNEAYIDIDRLRFRQVLSNIISNAIKNTPKEGEILINLVEKKDYIDIRVIDNGVGITEKEREKLFEKFGKIERYGMDLGVDIEGSGLGLYISKEIVELHGGQILVESEGRNKGSTFIIRLFKK